MNDKPRFNLTEHLACVAAGLIEDGCSVFVGTGFPVLVGMLAQRTHARHRQLGIKERTDGVANRVLVGSWHQIHK